MSKPFFIWTMQRTGGSSFAGLLMTISEHPHIVHEPFNKDRLFGDITRKFHKGEDVTNDLKHTLETTPNIKHCYELFNTEYNAIILESIMNTEYKHIFLNRKDDVSRIMSRYLAMQTEVWGPNETNKYDDIVSGKVTLEPFDINAMINHYHLCYQMTTYIQKKLTEKNIPYKVISFEDLYSGSREKRLGNIRRVFKYLEFDSNTINDFSDEIEKRIFNSSQDSKSILEYVPNYEEAKKALSEISDNSKFSILSSFQSLIHKIMKK